MIVQKINIFYCPTPLWNLRGIEYLIKNRVSGYLKTGFKTIPWISMLSIYDSMFFPSKIILRCQKVFKLQQWTIENLNHMVHSKLLRTILQYCNLYICWIKFGILLLLCYLLFKKTKTIIRIISFMDIMCLHFHKLY